MERVLFLKTTGLFQNFSLEELEAVDQRLVEEAFETGEVIFSEGSLGDRLYVIYRGEVSFVKGERQTCLNALGVGEHFGEISLFEGSPRITTAIAQDMTTVLSISYDEYRLLVTQRPELLFPLAKSLALRLRNAVEILAAR